MSTTDRGPDGERHAAAAPLTGDGAPTGALGPDVPGGAVPGPGRAVPFAVLAYGRFRALWLGVTVSACGTWLRQLAASVLMFEQTHSAAMVGLLNFVGFLPMFFLSIVGGHVVDRLSSRVVLLRAQVASATVSCALAVAALFDLAGPPVLLIAVGLLGTLYAFIKPAVQALLPGLVPPKALSGAIAANSLAFTLGLAIGPAAGTLTLRLAGPATAFLIDAASFVPLAVTAVRLPRAAGTRGAGTPAGRSIAEALVFVARRRMLLVLLFGMVASTVAIEIVKTLMPVFVAEELGLAPAAAGVLIGLFGIGSLAGAAAAPLLERRLGLTSATVSLALLGIAVVAFSNLRSVVAGGLLLVVAGVAFMVCTVQITTDFFRVVPVPLRGRVFAIHAMSFLGVSPFAALGSGALAEAAGVSAAGTVTGCFGLVGAIVLAVFGRNTADP